MEIKSICLIGGGRMGRQIALNAAIYGFKASVYDLSEAVCEDVKIWADEYLAGRVKKGRMTQEQVDKVKGLFSVETDLKKACEGVDCAIEAVLEREDVKRTVLGQLSDLLPEDAIIATNSSVMPSSKFAGDVKNASRLCNLHYYNPALVMKFTEVVQGPHTSEETAKACVDFCNATGKKPVLLKKELPGFLGNYLYGSIQAPVKELVHEGVCTPHEVDTIMEVGFGNKMGYFRTSDLSGPGLSLDIMNNRWKKEGVKPLMYDFYQDLVDKGRMGRSCGHGFYDYDVDPKGAIPPQFIPTNDPAANVPFTDIVRIAVIGSGPVADHIVSVASAAGIAVTQADGAQAFADAQLVIDATGEDLQSKRTLFAELSRLNPADTILATAAETVMSSQLADVVAAPQRLCNFHIQHPVIDKKCIEVVQSEHTSVATARACYELCLKLGAMPIWMKKEVPGFIGNYILSRLQSRARFMVHNGYCTFRDVDTSMEYGFNYKMGPFRLMDQVGIDVHFAQLKKLYAETGEKPDMYDQLEQMVAEGHLGKKSGKGFYDYN